MTPDQELDARVDAVIEAATPNLKIALRNVLSSRDHAAMFDAAYMPLPSGQQWQVSIAVMSEPFAAIATPILSIGMNAMMRSFEKLQKPAEPGFSVPGV